MYKLPPLCVALSEMATLKVKWSSSSWATIRVRPVGKYRRNHTPWQAVCSCSPKWLLRKGSKTFMQRARTRGAKGRAIWASAFAVAAGFQPFAW